MRGWLIVLTEHQEQSLVVDWFNNRYPKYAHLLIASANGANLAGSVSQRCAQMNKLKKSGLKVGFPDLQLCIARGGYHGLFIEMKRVKGGSISKDQKKYIRDLTDEGYKAVVCKGSDEAMAVIEQYLDNTMCGKCWLENNNVRCVCG